MKTGVIGSGTMGAGIARVAAMAGETVCVIDNAQLALDKARQELQDWLEKRVNEGKMDEEQASQIWNRIHWISSIHDVQDLDLVIEAIVEKLEVKQQLFKQLEEILGPNTILATNTSSLSVTSIASACSKPERVIGLHFFNPAPVMELVEVIPALQTDEQVVQQCLTLMTAWKKKGVLAKDTPGFIVNRIARPYYSEAIRIVEEGIAQTEVVDTVMKQYGGFRMGPFELMDLIGHDVNYTVTETVWKSFYYDSKYTPSFTQKRLVEAGWLGRKSGRGFYTYPVPAGKAPELEESKAHELFLRIMAMLINEAAQALYLGIGNREDLDLAMQKGVNYPKGLLAWADEIGIKQITSTLDTLFELYHEERYRCCRLLREMTAQAKTFY